LPTIYSQQKSIKCTCQNKNHSIILKGLGCDFRKLESIARGSFLTTPGIHVLRTSFSISGCLELPMIETSMIRICEKVILVVVVIFRLCHPRIELGEKQAVAYVIEIRNKRWWHFQKRASCFSTDFRMSLIILKSPFCIAKTFEINPICWFQGFRNKGLLWWSKGKYFYKVRNYLNRQLPTTYSGFSCWPDNGTPLKILRIREHVLMSSIEYIMIVYLYVSMHFNLIIFHTLSSLFFFEKKFLNRIFFSLSVKTNPAFIPMEIHLERRQRGHFLGR